MNSKTFTNKNAHATEPNNHLSSTLLVRHRDPADLFLYNTSFRYAVFLPQLECFGLCGACRITPLVDYWRLAGSKRRSARLAVYNSIIHCTNCRRCFSFSGFAILRHVLGWPLVPSNCCVSNVTRLESTLRSVAQLRSSSPGLAALLRERSLVYSSCSV